MEVLRRGRAAGRGERHNGPGTARVCRPPERHRKEGSLAAGQTRMSGALSLWLLSLCAGRRSAGKEKVTRPGGRNVAQRSNSRRLARRASAASKPRPSEDSKNSCAYKAPAAKWQRRCNARPLASSAVFGSYPYSTWRKKLCARGSLGWAKNCAGGASSSSLP